jgi:polysaccharide biosynthesis protein PslG
MPPAVLLLALLVALVLPAPAAADVVPGVQAHVLWSDVSRTAAERQLDLAAASGARLVRVDVGWSSLEEQGPGRWSRWHLERLDHVVDAAQRRGLRLLLTFWRTPCWASSAPASLRRGCEGRWWDRGVDLHPPRDPADFGRAAGRLAARYGTRVAGWEVWNEPNARSFLRARRPVQAYVRLLRAAYRAIKAAAPAVPVVGGSLMYADARWTARALRAGARGHFDAWSVHPYAGDLPPSHAGAPGIDPEVTFAGGVPRVRAALLAQGADVPLWLTELGWNTSPVRGRARWLDGVPEAVQARYVREALELARRWPYVEAFVVYGLLDRPSSRGTALGHFGLHRADGSPKPAAAAFRAAAAWHDPAG